MISHFFFLLVTIEYSYIFPPKQDIEKDKILKKKKEKKMQDTLAGLSGWC
jgi:hypothetical protein